MSVFSKFPARYVLAILGFWGCFNIFALRLNLSVAIVDMIGPSDPLVDQLGKTSNSSISNETVLVPRHSGEFNWDEVTQGIVLGCYFYGHGIFHLPGGRLSEMISPKWLYGIGLFATAVLSLLSPIAARFSLGAFIAVRALQGIFSGMVWPVLHTLLARWFPQHERAFLSSFVYTGRLIGAASTMEFSGLLIYGDVWGGWPSTFYVFGLIGIAWFVLWAFLIHDYPEHHPRVSADELLLIQKNTQGQVTTSKSVAVPWKKILTSGPVWALAVSHFGNSYGLETLMLLLPTYMSNVLGFDIQSNGHLSALPFLVDALTGFAAAWLSDYALTKGFGVTFVRKFFCAFAYLGAAACFAGVTLVGDNGVVAVILFLLALGFSGVAAPSVFVVQIDMAPDFAGTLMGLTSFWGSVAGIIAPYVVGVLTENQPTLDRWNIAFYIIVGVYIITTVIFVIFGSAELQPWAVKETQLLSSKEDNIQPQNSSVLGETSPLLDNAHKHTF